MAKTGRTAAELGRERGGPNRRVLCTGARAPGAGRARLALEQSRAILADARREAHPGDRYRLAHLAALRAAAALLSVHPDEAPSRRAPQSAWALIGRRVPRFADWAAYLGAGAATRAAAEAGIADAVSDGQAAELLDAVELFTFLVAAEVQDQRPGPAPVVPQAVGGGG
ncbi:MAG: SAV_6107 family HEPN domain-containing protein [Actinomycetota bacterium]|nr:SAV_6107 family HEPN domain-containing protein [Actinomycetota bacterium]